MSHARSFFTLLVAATLLSACSDRSPVGAEPESAASGITVQTTVAAAQSATDLSGDWNWSNEEVLRMPRWFVEAMGPLLGITPEGENTHARCESAGTMSLMQAGEEFEGLATKTVNACETRGGQAFQQPGVAFAIADGRITGGSLRFSFHSPNVAPCPHHAVIGEVEGGVAMAMSGAGRCILPGHPQSESPMVLDPPPGGTSTTLSWEAWRP